MGEQKMGPVGWVAGWVVGLEESNQVDGGRRLQPESQYRAGHQGWPPAHAATHVVLASPLARRCPPAEKAWVRPVVWSLWAWVRK
jgi:hypothetical protein